MLVSGRAQLQPEKDAERRTWVMLQNGGRDSYIAAGKKVALHNTKKRMLSIWERKSRNLLRTIELIVEGST